MSGPIITLTGGPTAHIEAGGFRLLTDPTFDDPGEYKLPHVTLKKTSRPALAAETAHAFPDATIVPVHYEGWAHVTQSGADLEQSFMALGLGARLRLLEPGVPTTVQPR